MDGWVGGWVDGLMDGWMDGCVDGNFHDFCVNTCLLEVAFVTSVAGLGGVADVVGLVLGGGLAL